MNWVLFISRFRGQLASLFVLILALTLLVVATYKPTIDTSVLASRTISLETRQTDRWVNSVFKDNILLNASYLAQRFTPTAHVSWEDVNTPFTYSFTLEPGQTFAYHDTVLPEYAGTVVKTSNAHFIGTEGFKSDGYLMGDGVCHLASLLYWAAKDAKLSAVAPTNHDFAVIPEVPKEYGVAIYYSPESTQVSAVQNMYITNTFDHPVTMHLVYDGTHLTAEVTKQQEEKQSGLLALLK